MKTLFRFNAWLFIVVLGSLAIVSQTGAERLFKGRQIYLGDAEKKTFHVGVKGSTAGYNYVALIEGAKQESISLGELGYWEKVNDPPSFLRNYDLQLIIKNQYGGNFQLEFEYNRKLKDIEYKILEGKVQVKLDRSQYYPVLIIDREASKSGFKDPDVLPIGSKRYLFFDFNSLDADLKRYYGRIKNLISDPSYTSFFYYYESTNYNSYYFRTYDSVGQLDSEKMGLSMEDGSLKYYQKVFDNLNFRHGADFADQAIIVSRFGKKFSRQLNEYAREIGVSQKMVVIFWNYDDLQ